MRILKHIWRRLARSRWEAYLAIVGGLLIAIVWENWAQGLAISAIGVGGWLLLGWMERHEGQDIHMRLNVYHLFAIGVLVLIVVYALGVQR